MIDPVEFQKSINQELQVAKNRVRHLIGDANWADEGTYKEILLRNVIRKYLPANLSVGKGYIMKNRAGYRNFKVSKQIDILVYDNTYPLIFSEGDFVIVIEDSVKGIIEVKSKIYAGRENSNSLFKILEKFNSFDQFPKIREKGPGRIFKGIFSYDFSRDINHHIIDESLRMSEGMVNHICLNSSIFIRHWTSAQDLPAYVDCDDHFYNIYDLEDLAHAYFISNLVHMSSGKELMDQYWISFPIEGSKEVNRDRTVCFDDRQQLQ
jgi:hypothetical protein